MNGLVERRFRDRPEISGSGILGVIVTTVSGGLGLIFWFEDLKEEVSVRSATCAFIGANVGFGWLFFYTENVSKWQYAPLALIPVLLGLVGAVLAYDGDVVKPQKTVEKPRGRDVVNDLDQVKDKPEKKTWDDESE